MQRFKPQPARQDGFSLYANSPETVFFRRLTKVNRPITDISHERKGGSLFAYSMNIHLLKDKNHGCY
ncbi:hypothetical protein A7K99_11020 [Tatumella citrea]|uniref:Uncharacterized protein n=1 Tax=Tatumella citrea TaxID=53336 RepID=A0A1Y0L906_TATCI|nr:hypothetical protein A7K98_11020 [Tatumella citrea]ARU98295.1 hypothetical protein A7K99_11020 [Tatumella citrea]